jgi:hypothetical protein
MVSRVTLVTAPTALVLGYAVFGYTDLPMWVAAGVVVVLGPVVPLLYESWQSA